MALETKKKQQQKKKQRNMAIRQKKDKIQNIADHSEQQISKKKQHFDNQRGICVSK